jgi:hypothetical protein
VQFAERYEITISDDNEEAEDIEGESEGEGEAGSNNNNHNHNQTPVAKNRYGVEYNPLIEAPWSKEHTKIRPIGLFDLDANGKLGINCRFHEAVSPNVSGIVRHSN